MSRFVCFLIAPMLLFCGCAGPYRDTCIYQRSGAAKPIVAVLPVLTSPESEKEVRIDWDLSQELTQQIRKRIFDSSGLYLLDGTDSEKIANFLNVNDLDSISHYKIDHVGAAQFVVVTKLVQHKETPVRSEGISEAGAHLALDFRVRVFDIRGEHPTVILQELFHHDHFIPRAYLSTDYSKTAWGTESFERTPMGIAHSRLAREVVSRVESYIQSARG